MLFTPENLIDNIEEIGPWSIYGLACEALQHYFPEEYDEDGYCPIEKELEMLKKLGCFYWGDVVIKYQTEVGYNAQDGFNPDLVNDR